MQATATGTESKIQLNFVEIVLSVLKQKSHEPTKQPWCLVLVRCTIPSAHCYEDVFGRNIDTTGKGFCWVSHLCTAPFPKV